MDSAEIRALIGRLAAGDTAALDAAPVRLRAGLEALMRGPDADAALMRASRLPDPVLDADVLTASTARLLHQGGYPGRLLALSHGEIAAEADGPTLADDLVVHMHDVGAAAALGAARTRHYLRLARREIDGAPLEEVGGDLSTLAAACIEASLRHLGIADDVVVFGMGKLGGNELNFLSDIDLMFVHRDDLGPGRDGVIGLHDKLRQLVRLLEGEGPYRPLFRVDLRLRPFGSRGPLSTSLTATESYYERYGRAWERQVWIRARPIAGALELGTELIRRLAPFVYRRSVSPEIFEEIGELMQRARRDAMGGLTGLDIKLDVGGIREVEFSVQALQLLHGGRNPHLRTPGTLGALDRLLAAGLVSDREHRSMTRAYRFLRRVEHRLQLAEGQQTHRVPEDEAARALLAARLDERDFDTKLAAHRERVAAVAQTMAGPVPPATQDRLAAILDAGAPTSVRQAALAQMGVRDPEEADALMQHLLTRADGALSSHGAARRGAEQLILACLDGSDPDAALSRFVEFAALRPAHYAVWRFFSEPPAAGQDLVRLTGELLGTGDPICRGLIGFPARGRLQDNTIGTLTAVDSLSDPAELAVALREQLQDPRGLDATLQRFKHQRVVSIALHDLGRRPDPMRVGRALSDLADLVVRTILCDLAADQERRATGMRVAVFALGKYGMQAMDYGSDLDLMFVFDRESREGTAVAASAARFGQRLIARLQDRSLGPRLYEVDMRLRPSGRQGLLVSPLAGFRRYHARPLPAWERLALLRLRAVGEAVVGAVVGGEPGMGEPGPLCREVTEIVEGTLAAPGTDAADVARDVRRLRDRIETELAREDRKRGRFNAKTGRGGCLELELMVSALQLTTDARTRSIIAALEQLTERGAFSQSEGRALAAAYRFQRLLLNRLRMTASGRIDDPDRFAQNSPRLTTLARRMGLPSREALLNRFFETREMVRGAFDRHLTD